jgi:hypothetical protein
MEEDRVVRRRDTTAVQQVEHRRDMVEDAVVHQQVIRVAEVGVVRLRDTVAGRVVHRRAIQVEEEVVVRLPDTVVVRVAHLQVTVGEEEVVLLRDMVVAEPAALVREVVLVRAVELVVARAQAG